MKITSKNSHTFLFILCFVFLSMKSVFATEKIPLWKNLDEQTQTTKQVLSKGTATPLAVRMLEFNELNFNALVNSMDNVAAKNSIDNQTITLPLPDGSDVVVEMTPNSVMSESLAKQFPQIKTWNVKGVSKNITGTIDLNHKGFHSMLFMPDGDRVFIEPDFEDNDLNEVSAQARYMSFSQKENEDNFNREFSCGAHDQHKHFSFAAKGNLLARPSSDLITYRLAVATTGEYSQFHGGTVASTLSAIATTINRVNQIYRRDFAIQFELVDEQADLIYLNPNTDPYTNSNATLLIIENNQNLSADGVLSKSRYDIGHVFGEGNVGGLAVVGGVCDNDEKAFGATGISSPVGLAFDLDFVAHELGHQVGATHTFNSNCVASNQRTGITAVEPGSGTTIMAYPGICGVNNIQNNVDPQFHVVSIDQITTLTRTGSGSSCGIRTSTTNENPTVNAGADMVVPARTPLVFEANGADTDNDDLTYSWEQTDAGTLTNLNIDSGDNALFRSRPLANENIRFIPRLSDLFSNTTSAGELLPVTNRDINMAVTVRDGNGGVEFDLVEYQVFDTGESFSVTSQTNSQSFGRQDTVNIRWNIAGTNASPISCANVDIGVVTSDGQGFDITTTANDGREEITIPADAPAINNGRIIVSCNTSNFFNVSSGRVTILDQVGGGTSSDDGGSSSGGGGSFNLKMLFIGLILIFLRKNTRRLVKVLKPYKNTAKSCIFIIPFLISAQACTTPAVNEASNSNAKPVKSKFGDRFSVEKIKQEREAYYAQKLEELKSKDPATEVNTALRTNDIYFLAVAANRGASRSIPGLVEPQAQIINCKTKAVEGMGDALYGKNHIRYRQEMLRYMSEFNTLMKSYCK